MQDTVLPVEAEKEWIEAPGGWGGGGEDSTSTSTSSPKEEEKDDDDNDNGDDESSPFDLFANVDKSLKFPFDVLTTITKDDDKISATIKKRLYLSGYKLDSDETAQSTGVTLWDAAPRLANYIICLLYTSPSPRDLQGSRMPSSA